MLVFENIEFLYALLLIPVLLFIFGMMLNWKKRMIRKFGDTDLVVKLMPGSSHRMPVVKFIFFILAYIFLVVGLTNPQLGSKVEEVKRKGIDLVIGLDLSNSMLAEDIKPNRLERAKQAISKLIDRLDGDRLGIVVFAGKAYMQLPITSDYAAAKLFLSTINTKIIPTQGTAIGDAIEMGLNSFDENDHSKAIIIITDGENHEGNAIEQATVAAEQGVQVYTIGMGLPEGSPIPLYNQYGNQIGFKKDRQNNTIITKLNETMLQKIAASGNGIYVQANHTEAGLNKIFDEINKLEEAEFESKTFSDYEDRFQYFIAIALILIIVEFLLNEKKSKWVSKIKLFG